MIIKEKNKLSCTKIKKLQDAEEVVKALKSYQYKYSTRKDDPLLIVGPSGGDTDLRVYAYGGCIGKIATEPLKWCKLAIQKDNDGEKNYSYGKYLVDGYQNGHGIVFDFESVPELKRLQEDMMLDEQFLSEFRKSNNQQKGILYYRFDLLAKASGSKKGNKNILENKSYLDLVISAAYTRFMHRRKDKEHNKTIIQNIGERSKQTLIAKQMQSLAFDEKAANMVVVDIECDVPFHYKEGETRRQKWNAKDKKMVDKENAKIDFVVFDGKSFGLIEFKYEGMSMESGTENSLEEHYLDFRRILCEEENVHRVELVIELIRRMDYLLTYSLIDNSWERPLRDLEEKVLQMKPEEYNSDMLWYGFYFVGGDRKYIEREIKKQLTNDVRYQIEDDKVINKINM